MADSIKVAIIEDEDEETTEEETTEYDTPLPSLCGGLFAPNLHDSSCIVQDSPVPYLPNLCRKGLYPFTDYDGCKGESGIDDVMTLLFADGTLAINVPNEEIENYISQHGAIIRTYDGWNDEDDYIFEECGDAPWYADRSRITSIVVASVISPVDTSYWFCDLENVITADVSNIDTSNTEQFLDMFYNCVSLEELDLSGWTFNDNTKFAWMQGYGAHDHIPNVRHIDLTDVDTSAVTDFDFMFGGMWYLESIDLSSFDTANGVEFWGMFSGDTSLTEIDVSMFDMSNATSINGMFEWCRSLVEIDLSAWNTDSLTYCGYMFQGCNSLQYVNASGWNTSQVFSMEYMFMDCPNLEVVRLCDWDTSNCRWVDYMFENDASLETIYTSDDWDTSLAITCSYMFYGCTSLVGEEGTTYNANYVDCERAKIDGGVGNEGYFTRCPR